MTMALQTCREPRLVNHIHRFMECGFFGSAWANQVEIAGKKSSLVTRFHLWNVSRGRGLRKTKSETQSHVDSVQIF